MTVDRESSRHSRMGTESAPFPIQRPVASVERIGGPVDSDARPTPARGVSDRAATWLRGSGLWLEMSLALLTGTAVLLALGAPHVGAVLVLLAWAVGAYHAGSTACVPFGTQVRSAVQNVLLVLGLAAVTVAVGAESAEMLRHGVPAAVAAATVSVVARTLNRRAGVPVRVVVVGDADSVSAEVVRLRSSRFRTEVVGAALLDGPDQDHSMTDLPTIRGLAGVADMVRSADADLVLVHAGPGLRSTDLTMLHRSLEDTSAALGLVGLLDRVAPHRIRARAAGSTTFLDVRPPRPSVAIRAAKAVGDRVVAGIAMLVLAPVLAALIVLIKIDSDGPAFFRQTRVGRDGERFELLKLRTMVQGADELKHTVSGDGWVGEDGVDAVLFKHKRDPRITRVGRFLRRTSLDELPQLLNVLKGQMSLVGPRPYIAEETARMGPDAMRRLAVMPGLTGLWQVSGRSDLSWDETVALDTYYADNWSLAGDAKIIAMTVPAVLAGRGAY